MKKISLIIPLIATSFLASCASKIDTVIVTFDAGIGSFSVALI